MCSVPSTRVDEEHANSKVNSTLSATAGGDGRLLILLSAWISHGSPTSANRS